jgi:hypothetical protein
MIPVETSPISKARKAKENITANVPSAIANKIRRQAKARRKYKRSVSDVAGQILINHYAPKKRAA